MSLFFLIIIENQTAQTEIFLWRHFCWCSKFQSSSNSVCSLKSTSAKVLLWRCFSLGIKWTYCSKWMARADSAALTFPKDGILTFLIFPPPRASSQPHAPAVFHTPALTFVWVLDESFHPLKQKKMNPAKEWINSS